MDQLRCKRCNTELASDAVECFACGFVLNADAVRVQTSPSANQQPAPANPPSQRWPLLVLILGICLANCLVWFLMSLLAVGDGGSQGIKRLWVFGFGSIGVLTCVALMIPRRLGVLAGVLTALQIPLIMTMLNLSHDINRRLVLRRQSTPEMVEACKDVGAHYIAAPAAPVRSIAYSWANGVTPPYYTHFNMDERGNVSQLEFSVAAQSFPPPIEYVEARCCRTSQMPANDRATYERADNRGIPTGERTSRITADVLIEMSTTRLSVNNSVSALEQMDFVVTDRRDGKRLATMRYVLSATPRRACGATSLGMMDERAFVMKALGL